MCIEYHTVSFDCGQASVDPRYRSLAQFEWNQLYVQVLFAFRQIDHRIVISITSESFLFLLVWTRGLKFKNSTYIRLASLFRKLKELLNMIDTVSILSVK